MQKSNWLSIWVLLELKRRWEETILYRISSSTQVLGLYLFFWRTDVLSFILHRPASLGKTIIILNLSLFPTKKRRKVPFNGLCAVGFCVCDAFIWATTSKPVCRLNPYIVLPVSKTTCNILLAVSSIRHDFPVQSVPLLSSPKWRRSIYSWTDDGK